MSVPNQANGKKSSNSSIANTPASTPITNSNGNSQAVIHNSPPPNNNAPKYGTLVPNRIFVGGISANTTEGELLQLFSSYGTVKAAKIIQDRAGVSKGYGFITFESEDDAKRPLREADNIVLRERKLNIAPAIKKQPFNFNRAFDGSSPPTVTVGNPTQYFLPPGAMPYFQGSVGYYAPPNGPAPGDPGAQQPAVYQPPPVYPAQTGPPQAATYPSMMFPAQTIYMPQQYPMPMPYDYNYYPSNGAPPQYMVGTAPQGGPGPQQGPPLPPSGSPPRPPCYNQQISYATEPVFYNVPMYGGPMDHPPVYPDAIESAGNPYAEESYVGQFNPQDIVDVRYPTQDTPPDTTTTASSEQHHQNIITSSSGFSTIASMTNAGRSVAFASTQATSQPQPHHQQGNVASEQQPDTTRQTSTPVVSLLSIDHTQEKDLNSMQGGRKKKPISTTGLKHNTSPNVYSPVGNGFNPTFQGMNYPPPQMGYPPNVPAHAPAGPFPGQCPPFGYNNIPSHVQFNGPIPPFDYGQFKYPKYSQMNGYAKKPVGRRPFDRRNTNMNVNNINDYSNRSSVRTDSNSSSASAVDENRNHEDKLRTSVTTPPPAPYSPLTNHGYASRFNGVVSSNVQFNVRQGKSFTSQQPATQQQQHDNINRRTSFKGGRIDNNGGRLTISSSKSETTTAVTSTTDISNNNINNNVQPKSDVTKTNAIVYDSNASQVHSGGGSSSFAPMPARRSRRSIRRSNVGATLSEIGAGDAPLPPSSDPVSEACKKLDSLKL